MINVKWEAIEGQYFQVGGEIVVFGIAVLAFALGYMVLGRKGNGKK